MRDELRLFHEAAGTGQKHGPQSARPYGCLTGNGSQLFRIAMSNWSDCFDDLHAGVACLNEELHRSSMAGLANDEHNDGREY